LITNELVKTQPTKIVDFITHQLIDFVRTSKRKNYHLLSEGKEVSEAEFDSKYLDKTVTITKDTSGVTKRVRCYFNYFTQKLWFIYLQEDCKNFDFPPHHHLEFILSFNLIEVSSISLILDEFHKDLQEMVKNHLLYGDKKSFSILEDFSSLKSSKYLMNFDPLNLKYLLLDKEYWIQNPTEEPGNLFATRNFLSVINSIDFTSLSESDSEEDKLFLKLFKNSLTENLIPDYDSKSPLRTSLGINLAYSFESNFLKLKAKHKEEIEKLFKMFSLILNQDELDILFTSLSKNSYFTVDEFLLSYLKSERVIEKNVDFAAKLIHNSMRSIKSDELSSKFFLGLVDFVKEENLLELFNQLSLTVTITDRDVQKILEDYSVNSPEAKSLLKLLSLVKKSQSTAYYKLTNLKKMENLTLEGIHNAWNECTGYFNNNFEETRFTKIEILFQGISQKISELNFHLNVSKKCQQEEQTQKSLKMLTDYKVSLEGVKKNLQNIVKQIDF
jgi:hypothetical protein